LERVERIRALTAQQPGLQLAGNQFTGVGLPQCIRSGDEAARRIVAALAGGACESSEEL
jgi:oxygen-dependent protoporphyrinogen oxidase